MATIGAGNWALFWLDIRNLNIYYLRFPFLYIFAEYKECSVAQFLQNPDIRLQFNLPLSMEAFEEYKQLIEDIKILFPINNCSDVWTYICGMD